MSNRARIAIVLFLILAVVVSLLEWRRAPTVEREPAPVSEQASGRLESTADRAPRIAASPDGEVRPVKRPAHSAAQRRALLESIAAARGQRLATGSQAPAPAAPAGSAAPLDIVDKTGDTSPWQKRALATLNSLLGECYALAQQEQPDLAGTFTVQFTIAGEPKVGGLLERVEIDEQRSTIQLPTLRECMTESLYALELDPPPSGVQVERELSLRFP